MTLDDEVYGPLNGRHDTKHRHSGSLRDSPTSSTSTSTSPTQPHKKTFPPSEYLGGQFSPATFPKRQSSITDLQHTREGLLRLEGQRSETPQSLRVPNNDEHSSSKSRHPSPCSSRGGRFTNDSSSDGSQVQNSDRHKHPTVGGDAQADLDAGRRRERSSSRKPQSRPPEASRRVRSGQTPNLDRERHHRPPAHPRPPMTKRTSTQYSKVVGSDPSQWSSVHDSRPGPLSRRESYSSATGISPVPDMSRKDGPYTRAYSNMMEPPPTLRTESLRPIHTHGRVEQIDGALPSPGGSLGLLSSASLPYYSGSEGQNSFPVAPRKKVDDFEFLNTIDTTDRPYTPDRFAIEAMRSQNEQAASRASSRKSASLRSLTSLASLGGLSLRSVGNVGPNTQGTHNVLKKIRPEARTSEDDMRAMENTFQNIAGKSSTKSKRPNNNSATLLQDLFTPDMPHTATSCAGPSRGVVMDGNRSSSETDAVQDNSHRTYSFSRFRLASFSGEASMKAKVLAQKASEQKASEPEDEDEKQVARQPSIELAKEETENPEPNEDADPVVGTTRKVSYATVTSTDTFAYNSSSPANLISNAYRQTNTILRQTISEGWPAAYEAYKERRALERTYRYGNAGKKINVYMSGALPVEGDTLDGNTSPIVNSGEGQEANGTETSPLSNPGTVRTKRGCSTTNKSFATLRIKASKSATNGTPEDNSSPDTDGFVKVDGGNVNDKPTLKKSFFRLGWRSKGKRV